MRERKDGYVPEVGDGVFYIPLPEGFASIGFLARIEEIKANKIVIGMTSKDGDIHATVDENQIEPPAYWQIIRAFKKRKPEKTTKTNQG